MSRQLMRVPLNFKWPKNEIWKGYRNPYRPTKCKQCKGSGESKEMQKLKEDWYRLESNIQYSGWCYNLEQADADALVKKVYCLVECLAIIADVLQIKFVENNI